MRILKGYFNRKYANLGDYIVLKDCYIIETVSTSLCLDLISMGYTKVDNESDDVYILVKTKKDAKHDKQNSN